METELYFSVVNAEMLRELGIRLQDKYLGQAHSLKDYLQVIKELRGKPVFEGMYPAHSDRLARRYGMSAMTVADLIWMGPYIQEGGLSG